MEENKNLDKTIVDESSSDGPATKSKSNRGKNRQLKFKNLTVGQKRLLESSASGLSGVALGSVAMALMGASGSAEPAGDDPSDSGSLNPVDIPIYPEAPFSDVVTDDMSFNEAFAAARKDIGAGGFFEWEGSTYNSYYKEEWEALSPEEQGDFMASVNPPSGGDAVSEDIIIQILNGDEEDPTIDILDHEDIVILDDDPQNPIDLDDVVIIDDDFDVDELDDVVVIEDNDPDPSQYPYDYPNPDLSDIDEGDEIALS